MRLSFSCCFGSVSHGTYLIAGTERARRYAQGIRTRGIPGRFGPLSLSQTHSQVIYRCLKTPPKLMDLPSTLLLLFLLPPSFWSQGSQNTIILKLHAAAAAVAALGIEYLELTKRETRGEGGDGIPPCRRPRRLRLSLWLSLRALALICKSKARLPSFFSSLSFVIPSFNECFVRLGGTYP